MIQAALKAILMADSDVTGLIGNKFRPSIPNTRDDIPYVDYQLIGEREDEHAGGTSGVCFCEVEMTSFAEDPATASQIDQTIRDVMCGTPDSVAPSKSMPRGIISGTSIDIRRISSVDLSSEPDFGSRGQNQGPFASRRVYQITYRRTA